MDTKEIKDYIKDIYFGFVEGEHFLSYCNGYGDGYIDCLLKLKLITKKQHTNLYKWNNEEMDRWYTIAKKDCKYNVANKIGNLEDKRG